MATPRRRFREEERQVRHEEWEREVRQKAVATIKRYEVDLPEDRIWTETRRELSRSGVLPRHAYGRLFHSLMLPPKRKWVTIGVHSGEAVRDLNRCREKVAGVLCYILGKEVQVRFVSYSALLS